MFCVPKPTTYELIEQRLNKNVRLKKEHPKGIREYTRGVWVFPVYLKVRYITRDIKHYLKLKKPITRHVIAIVGPKSQWIVDSNGQDFISHATTDRIYYPTRSIQRYYPCWGHINYARRKTLNDIHELQERISNMYKVIPQHHPFATYNLSKQDATLTRKPRVKAFSAIR